MTRIPRITVAEVEAREARGEPFTFVDARNPTAWAAASQQLPGAIRVPADRVDDYLEELPSGRAIVTYCT